MILDDRETAFLAQEKLFMSLSVEQCGFANLGDVPDVTTRLAVPLRPTLIEDYRKLTDNEIQEIAKSYYGAFGVSHFLVTNPHDASQSPHPLLEVARQLRDVLPLKHPVEHPMERHPEAAARFGPPDGTLKIYDLDTRDGRTGYREQAETSEMFDAHNDGLGYAGAVEAFMLYADSAPLWGGYTYFQNLIPLGLNLARTDSEAFASLFLPDAITALRPRGKGAIKVTTPVFFLNEHGNPQAFFRVQTGEYSISWRANCPPLERAARFLESHTKPFAPGSSFVHLNTRGSGCIARNHWVVHGRTPFIDGTKSESRRVLARKWFMSAPHHAQYKHVPGMHILERFASIYPERFGPSMVEGDWNYDAQSGDNIRKH